MKADITMHVEFDRACHVLCDTVGDLMDQGYSLDQIYCALGVVVGTTGANCAEPFLIGLAGGASYLKESRASAKEAP